MSTQFFANASGGFFEFAWNSSTSGSRVIDWTGGSTTAANYWRSGAYAEAVDERPATDTSGAHLYPLLNYSTANWDNAKYYQGGDTSTSSWLRSGNAGFLYAVDGSGYTIENGSGGSTVDAFNDTWHYCA
ncbi:hypothetical protein EV189_0832 [Motilibacter rhizosphaerae]|uniref:Uncharacterized protein n=1 Tax=Motilibacter rhizosphaerae TaxID=598652 RepID=A0A4Q7NWI9_9ACTN|nr:hypothetical protein [Motilibacter rhizosphaerae]RZS91585.1 hypothetical protein EV189_0832 [Motilibacter rhizosphaerae]